MEHPTQSTSRDVFALFWKHLKKHKWLTAFISIGLFAFIYLEALAPSYYKKLIDVTTQTTGDRSTLLPQLLGILVMVAVIKFSGQIAFRILDYTNAFLSARIMAELTNTAFGYTIRHSYQFFTDTFSGSLVKKIQRLARSFEGLIDQFVYSIIQIVFLSAYVIIALFILNKTIGALMLVWVILFVVINTAIARWIRPLELEKAKKDSEGSGALSDSITNSTNIKLFNGYGHEQSIVNRINQQVWRLHQKVWSRHSTGFGFQGFFMFIIEIVTVYLVLKLWAQNILTVGDFVLIQGYLALLFGRLWNISNVFRHVSSALSDAKEMMDILGTPHEIKDAPRAKKLRIETARITFEHVSFKYNEDRPVLDDFSLIIEPREKVALIGQSGAGKSTVTKLLFRLYNIEGGKIEIDGQDISKVTQESLREAIAMVPQEPILFHRSLMENIRYGRREATDKDVFAAAKKAHCHEFITKLPNGYETLVGERGIKLSGGERQRVAIARAILKDAPILVLDEATSSLDSESELLIQEALHELMKNKTVIVIAHRLSTIMEMDRIAVVENGTVVDAGTHHNLLTKTGTYKKLWEIQAGGFIP